MVGYFNTQIENASLSFPLTIMKWFRLTLSLSPAFAEAPARRTSTWAGGASRGQARGERGGWGGNQTWNWRRLN